MDPETSTFQQEQDEESSLWDSPIKASQGNPRNTYEQQEVRDLELRRELENVRKVNEAIEGVIESLGKAKANIKVANYGIDPNIEILMGMTDREYHCQRRINAPQHLDTYFVPDRAQSATHT